MATEIKVENTHAMEVAWRSGDGSQVYIDGRFYRIVDIPDEHTLVVEAA